MSRIGLQPISIPKGVKVEVEGDRCIVEGPKGQVTQPVFRECPVTIDDGVIKITRINDSGPIRAKHGLSRALYANAVTGVTEGFKKQLEVVGVGYRGDVKGREVHFALGYSHPVIFPIPDGIEIEIDKKNVITVQGADRQKVGQVAAEIRSLRPPDPYKAKGIRYSDETIRRKVGKAGARALPFLTPAFIGAALGTGITDAKAAVEKGDNLGVAKAASNTIAEVANVVTFGVTGLVEKGLRAAVEEAQELLTPKAKPETDREKAERQRVEFLEDANTAVATAVAAEPKKPWEGDQREAMADIVDRTGMGGLYGGHRQPAEHEARSGYQDIAAQFARTGSNRASPKPTPPVIPERPSQVRSAPSGGALRGFANPDVQKAAQEGRRRKR